VFSQPIDEVSCYHRLTLSKAGADESLIRYQKENGFVFAEGGQRFSLRVTSFPRVGLTNQGHGFNHATLIRVVRAFRQMEKRPLTKGTALAVPRRTAR
jgi:hypothetical protein